MELTGSEYLIGLIYASRMRKGLATVLLPADCLLTPARTDHTLQSAVTRLVILVQYILVHDDRRSTHVRHR